MKRLLLYGIKCRPWVWAPFLEQCAQGTFTVVDYPRSITSVCRSLAELTDWVDQTYLRSGGFDRIVGHSMGGLLALKLAVSSEGIRQTVLVDCFVRDTGPFFQNLLMPSAPAELRERLTAMLAEENEHYSASLKQELRETKEDFASYVARIPHAVHGIYGDRGEPDHVRTCKELQLPDEALARLQLDWVPNASHFPMLENPGAFAACMQRLSA